jgi:hypothetical protein
VGGREERAEPVARQVALAAATFPGDGRHPLEVPRGERFDDAAECDYLGVFGPTLVLGPKMEGK